MLGRSLGNYGVVSKIGEGGMGVVYLAKHVTLGRRAAIKVLRPDLSSNQDIISRFFNEARAATAVRNPGIVEVYDFGFLEDRTAYIIMEYLDGESLASRIRRGRAPIGATLTIVRAIARILQSAHEQGIVHRDLKPDNVFLVPDAELASGERVKLLDFGIAKLAHGLGNASHTTTGTVMGTPTYMAPEQCRGAGAVDHRADLYSLGCLAYEMLCGQPPFVADGPGDVIARHLYFEPAPLRSHRSEIPPELEVIILRLLKKEPRDRYSNAAEFVRATDPLMKGTPSAAAPPGDVLKTEFVATLAVVSDTTLNGAASSRSTPKARPSSRFTLIAGAVGVTIAILVFVLVIFTRGARNGDATSSPMVAATGEPRATEGLVPSAPLASAPSTPQATLPGGVATPSAGAPSAAASPKNLTPDTHSGETGLSPNPTASVVPAPDVAPPTPAPRVEPSAPAGATSSGEAGRPAVGTADADNVG
jgi:serine/threonine protein kinase